MYNQFDAILALNTSICVYFYVYYYGLGSVVAIFEIALSRLFIFFDYCNSLCLAFSCIFLEDMLNAPMV